MRNERADANYAILTNRAKLHFEKKPVSNLLSMQSVGFEQTFMKSIEIFVCKNNFFTGKKT